VTANQTIRWVIKPTVFVTSLVPFAVLLNRLVSGNLGADPLGEITNGTGIWTLRFVSVTLAITPVRRLTGWNAAIRFRRMVGLFAFFYGSLHLTVFVVADRLAALGFPDPFMWRTMQDLAESIGEEVFNRSYITLGFTSWLIMAALAMTSTAGMIRRLGGKRWQALHRTVYVAAIAGVVHYWWSVRADVRGPRTYAIVVTALLASRVVVWMTSRARLSRVLLSPASRVSPVNGLRRYGRHRG
jgi:methionine sulfoxide reductase heme-binding subunit